MTVVKLSPRKYVTQLHGRGIYGRYSKVRMPHGYGIVDTLGKTATKHVLGGVGKATASHYGKQLGKLIGAKTGSPILGSIAKAGFSALGGLAGQKLGSTLGNVISNRVFTGEDKKKKKDEEKVSLNSLLE